MTESGRRYLAIDRRRIARVDRELRDWLKSLAGHGDGEEAVVASRQVSDEAADYLERIATDGTLKAAFAELAESEPDLAG